MQKAGMLSRSITIRWNDMKMIDVNLPKFQKKPVPSHALGCTKRRRGGSRVAEKVMVTLVDNKLSINQHCAHAVTIANQILGCSG